MTPFRAWCAALAATVIIAAPTLATAQDWPTRSMQLVSADSGHLTAMCEVQFKPAGSLLVESFVISTELTRVGHEWRIVPPSGDAALPTWQPYRGAVDI